MTPDPDLGAELARVRPEQDDAIARLLESRVAAALGEPAPVTIDRFVIEHRIGVGAMGVVYAARDPKLERVVALKIVRGNDPDARDRLLAEARALARLAHPNVVAVHDVDVVGDDVFLAMELVRGTTAREWSPASWRDAVRVFRDAGLGLAAAHAAGIVHGDIKPENVIVGDDGRVRVLDFGLAHDARTGTHGGTPAYMAPEQCAGAACDAKADQYSFCVSLHEKLHGRRPRDAGDIDRIAGRVGRRVHAALQRGLAADPAARFPTMEALLAALDVAPRARLPLAIAAVAAVAVAGAAIVAMRRDPADPCTAGLAGVTDAWNADRAAALRRTFAASGRRHAATSAELVIARFDAYAAALHDAGRRACEIARTDPPRLAELRASCLERQRDAMATLADVLAHADAKIVDEAVTGAHALTPASDCMRSDQLLAAAADPADLATAVRRGTATALLARANALHDVGAYPRAAPVCALALGEARAIPDGALEAEALYLTGVLQSKRADAATADTTFRATTRAAERAGDDALAARAWIQLARIATRRARFDDGIQAAEQARAKLPRVADRETIEAFLELNLGMLEQQRGRLVEADRLLHGALARYEAIDPERPRVVSTLTAIAALAEARGDKTQAIASAERATALAERLFGPSHPATASALKQLASARSARGEHEAAIPLELRAIAILRDSHGAGSDAVAGLEHNLGLDLQAARRFDEAEAHFREAIRIRTELDGADAPSLAKTYAALAATLAAQHRLLDARRLVERALAIDARVHGDDAVPTSLARYNLSTIDHELGRDADALREATRSRAAFAAALGEQHQKVGVAELAIGQALVGLHRTSEALAHLESALAIAERGAPPLDVANIQRTLGAALWSAPRSRARARDLLAQARNVYAAAGPGYTSIVREVDAWLDSR